ncbi:MAG: ABC transporter ATP-binding protein, partial [Chloroflexi bacterium]|nr:ABC transporter ATP-binding protein [Chloroflexota bacterium]
PGVSLANFLRSAVKAVHGDRVSATQFRRLVREKMAFLKMDEAFLNRYVNDGFSGGEKKRAEILQMSVLQPEIAVLDETDSGLDIDALRQVAEGVNALAGPGLGILIITHYQRILNYIQPDVVHVMIDGRIARSGGRDLVAELEANGYDWLTRAVGTADERR